MTILRLLICLNLCCISLQAQQNYNEYHSLINDAEIAFFEKQDVVTALHLYDSVFNKFKDFIFVKDLINASQIAYFSEHPYQKYLIQGFAHGLKFDHYKRIPMMEPLISQWKKDPDLLQNYQEQRQVYLSKIDFDLLDWTYDIGIKDQAAKNTKEYKHKKRDIYNALKLKINTRGFPGERSVGVADSTIFREVKHEKSDFNQRTQRSPLISDYFKSDDGTLTSKMGLLILIHNFESYVDLKDVWKKEISLGNIHPRDVALLHDNRYRGWHTEVIKVFGNNMFVSYDRLKWLEEESDQLRKEWHIVPIKIDHIKQDFENKHGFKLFWGFWDCR